ncbi:MAG: hypothetical protein GC134_05365 [Proteobacteria bacterium]|nr:hypothetical protein [Pseudomonadota bacterium]
MNTFFTLFGIFWRNRYALVLPFLILPTLAVIYSANTPAMYTARTTIQIQNAATNPPLLQNISDPDKTNLLRQTIKSANVVGDTLRAAGLLLDGASSDERNQKIAQAARNIHLQTIGDDLIEIYYRSTTRAGITTVLEQLALNFIDEINAGERFSADETQEFLERQLRELSARLNKAKANYDALKVEVTRSGKADSDENIARMAAAEFEIQKIQTQYGLAKEDFDKVLSEKQSRSATPTVKFPLPPMLENENPEMEQHMSYLLASIVLAGLLSLTLIALKSKLDTSLRTDDEIRREIGLKIIGRMPNMGDVKIDQGRLTAMPKMGI